MKICLESLQTVDVVISDCKVTDGELNVIYESFFQKNHSKRGLLNNLYRNSYLGCCMAFKKSILDKALPFPLDIPMHDIWLGFVAELFYKTIFIKKPLILYRRHGNNTSTTSEISHFGMKSKLKFRWNLIKYIYLLLNR